MHSDQAVYRELYDAILDYERWDLKLHVLMPWIENNPDEVKWLKKFSARRGDPIPPATIEEIWRLYALSRVNQILLLRFQQGRADETDWQGPELSIENYCMFMELLGARIAVEDRFTPFSHEIVSVDQSEHDNDPIEVLEYYWPAAMFGNMMFSRAGVRVCGGKKFIDKTIAESSTLYWAFRRKNRPYEDLSHGWGSNSQWRTSFRRDYRIGDTIYYNVDEKVGDDELDLTDDERIELVTNRCFIRTTKKSDDLFPYGFHAQINIDSNW